MALGLRVSIGAGLATCAALYALSLPPRPSFTQTNGFGVPSTPEDAARAEAFREVMAAVESARRLQWTDSLVPLVHGAAEHQVPFVIGVPSRLAHADGSEVDSVGVLSGHMAAQLDQLEIARPSVDLGVFLVGANTGIDSPYGRINESGFEWYAGVSKGRPYCLSVRTSREPTIEDLTSYRWGWDPHGVGVNILGPCVFYAHHGMPGPAIHRWMLESGGERGTELYEAPLPDYRMMGNRPAWFTRRETIPREDLPFHACFEGTAEACAELVLGKRDTNDLLSKLAPQLHAAGVPLLAAAAGSGGAYSVAGVASVRMLHDLEQRFGTEAFDRFWHSNAAVADAFEAAFGTTPAEWGRQWVDDLPVFSFRPDLFQKGLNPGAMPPALPPVSRYGDRDRADVMPAAGDAGLTILYLVIALTIAASLAGRRRLG